MYAVIKTGGKQYRVKAGDLLVVERLAGDPGAQIAFGEVLMLGEGEDVTLGAPLVAGASVSATLIETRKGEKVKIFKKIRRQGYRRTRGHRQYESVLRVTGIDAEGRSERWDGKVDLTPLSVLKARSRNLARGMEAAEARAAERAAAQESTEKPAKAAAETTAKAPAAKAKKAAASKSAASKATAKPKAAAKKTSAAKPSGDAG